MGVLDDAWAEVRRLREVEKELGRKLDERAQIAVNAINRAEKAEAEYARIVDEFHALIPDLSKANARAEKAEERIGQLDLQLQLMVQVCEKLEARIKELEGTLKDLRGHLVDGLDDDAYLVLVIDRALAASEKEKS
jgi:chromosome segregation ATPase